MYGLRNIVARSRNQCCLGNATIRFLCNAVDRHAAVIKIPVFSVVMELQKLASLCTCVALPTISYGCQQNKRTLVFTSSVPYFRAILIKSVFSWQIFTNVSQSNCSWTLEESLPNHPLYERISVPQPSRFYPCFSNRGDRGRVAQWLRRYATNRKVAGSIPDDVIGILLT